MAGFTNDSKNNNKAGFTLPELLVVLTIISLVYLLAFPVLSQRHRQLKVAGFENRLIQLLKITRDKAIRQNVKHAVTFNANARSFSSSASNIKIDTPHSLKIRIFATAEKQKNDKPILWFFHDGSSSGGTIKLVSSKTVATISIDWLTGIIRQTGKKSDRKNENQ